MTDLGHHGRPEDECVAASQLGLQSSANDRNPTLPVPITKWLAFAQGWTKRLATREAQARRLRLAFAADARQQRRVC